jgi:tetratricopeptide (TPR) repeat protein
MRASAWQAMGRYEEALSLRVAVREKHADFLSLGAEAALLDEMGRHEESAKRFDEARSSLRGTSPLPVAWLWFQIATAAERAGDRERAHTYFAAAHDRFPAFAHATAHLASYETPDKAIDLLRPLADGSDDPEYAASLASALRRTGDVAGADKYLAQARSGFDRVTAAHPEAFADHAAWFWAAEGGDPKKAVDLAKANVAVRKTERSYEVLLVAASAANDKPVLCEGAREASVFPYASPALKTLAARSLRGCPQHLGSAGHQTTWTGAERSIVVPSPSCPLSFAPQHRTSPATIAQTCAAPAATRVAPPVMPATWTLVPPSELVSPLPAWPRSFLPTQ